MSDLHTVPASDDIGDGTLDRRAQAGRVEAKVTRDGARVSMLDTLSWLRQRRGLTQNELAASVGVGRQAVSAWETGAAQPHLRQIERLAEVLRLRREDVFTLLERRRRAADTPRSSSLAGGRHRRGRARPQPVERPPANQGPPPGPPRGDARILACLGDGWSTAHEVARQLRISRTAAQKALWRAERRGLLEHRAGGGYRATCTRA